MKRLALIFLVALVFPGTALAKGPAKAMIVGPGIEPITISGAEGSATPFWRLVEATGWFEAAYGPRLPQEPPPGDLGPGYTITWAVPSSNRLHQDVYPYAKPSPVTYMRRGQEIYDAPVKGGWFVGGPKLEKALARVGVPAQAPHSQPSGPTEPPTPASSSGLSARGITGIVAAGVVLALALLLAIRAIRRPRRTIAA